MSAHLCRGTFPADAAKRALLISNPFKRALSINYSRQFSQKYSFTLPQTPLSQLRFHSVIQRMKGENGPRQNGRMPPWMNRRNEPGLIWKVTEIACEPSRPCARLALSLVRFSSPWSLQPAINWAATGSPPSRMNTALNQFVVTSKSEGGKQNRSNKSCL